jgi:O-antigen/teichoic acid export membrane protein
MPSQPHGLYKKTILSGKWYMMSVFGQKVLNLLTFFVLARFLVPEDYGVITVVILVTGLANMLTTIPFGDALTREQGSIESYLDPLWSFDLVRVLVLSVALYFSGPFIARFFHLAQPYEVLLRVGGLLWIIPALANIRQLYFFRNLEFHKLFVRDIVAQIAFAAGAILYAWQIDASAWALFVGYIAMSVAGLVASYALYPSWPRLSFAWIRLRDLWGYTKWVFGQDFLEFLIAQIDKLVVGRLLDGGQLGIYAKAKDLASTATVNMASLLSKVGFAAFARIQDRPEKVQEGFVKSVDLVLISVLPFALLLLLEGGAVISVFLGQQWLVLVVPLKIFSLGNIFYAFSSIVSPILAALGRPEINFKTNVLRTLLMIPLLYLGYTWSGMQGLAWAMIATWMIMLVYIVWQTRRVMQIPKTALLPSLMCAGLAGIATVAADMVSRMYRPEGIDVYLALLLVPFLGLVYFIVLFVSSRRFGRGPWPTLLSIWREIGFRPRVVVTPPPVVEV